MSATPQRRFYVIEHSFNPIGNVYGYAAYWVDDGSGLPLPAREIYWQPTVADMQALMRRHYPLAECAYVPPDVAALVEQAREAMEGDGS